MRTKKRSQMLTPLQLKASQLDWIIHWDDGYWITSTDAENKGLIIYGSYLIKDIKKKVSDTLWFIKKAKRRG